MSSSPPLLSTLWIWDDPIPREAAQNMALDEAILAAEPAEAVLRIYEWASPSVSMGYFQKWDETRQAIPPEATLVRRSTGGGLVDHRNDVTYSLIVPKHHALTRSHPASLYERIHKALAEALHQVGITGATLATCCLNAADGACFSGGHAQYDVLLHTRKVAGAAQRRSRDGLLHQGSILLQDLPPEFWNQFRSQLADKCSPWEPEKEIFERAEQLEAEKYGAPEWLKRR